MRQYDLKNGRAQNKPPFPTKNDRNFGKNLSEYFLDYSSNTSIQGIKYLGERNRSIFEKLFWLIFLSTSVYWCSYLINKVYNKWQNAPVIVTFSNNLMPVWEVPFPAITICPEAKTNKSVYDYSATYRKFQSAAADITEEELKHFEQLNFLCGDTTLLNGSKNLIGSDTIDFIFKVAPNSDGWWCKWNHSRGDSQPCNTLLTPVLTDDGVCFTFNMLDREELYSSPIYYYRNFLKHGRKSTNWSLETGYSNDVDIDDFPRRTSAGFTLSFNVALLAFEPEIDYTCRGTVLGYKILLHNPAEMPRMNRNFLMAGFNKQILVVMKPDLMTTSDDLQSYDPQKRQCYYSHERQLKYFQVYTESNCELECLTNHTLKICGCVDYYMPRDTTTGICGRDNANCMADAERVMIREEMKLKNVNYESQERCNCLPSCTSLIYDTETSEIDHDWQKGLEAKDIDINASGLALTQVYFLFKVQHFLTTERKELYGMTDFVANCGGFLGLFIGFSFLSIVEVIYFLTLRVICNVKARGLQYWSDSGRKGLDSHATCNSISSLSLNNHVLSKHRLTVINGNQQFGIAGSRK